MAGILHVFDGGNLEIKDKYSFSFPKISSKEQWEQVLNELFINSEKFAQHIEHLSETQLNQVFVDKKYGSYRRNIEGVIEHAYYHLGQISLLKKRIEELDK